MDFYEIKNDTKIKYFNDKLDRIKINVYKLQ